MAAVAKQNSSSVPRLAAKQSSPGNIAKSYRAGKSPPGGVLNSNSVSPIRKPTGEQRPEAEEEIDN